MKENAFMGFFLMHHFFNEHFLIDGLTIGCWWLGRKALMVSSGLPREPIK